MIIHVTPSYPPRLGGLEKVVQVLAGTQLQLGQDVSVITSDHGAKDGVHPEAFNVERLKSFELANTTVVPGLFSRLLHLTRKDVVHLHVTQAFTPEMVWLASKFKHFPYIAHIHLDVPPSGPAGFLLKLYKPLFLKPVLRSAGFVIVFTEDQKQEVHRKYHIALEKIQVIPNGVESKFYYDIPRKPHEKPRLLYVGRLNYQKNLPQLLNALDGVSDRFQTDLIGDGELASELQELASRLRLKNITFVGRMDGEKLLDYYRQADMFVLSSEREGMPLVLLEAMAMGLPIVATNVTGSRDVVHDGQNGLLVPHNDAAAFKAALLKLGFNQTFYATLNNNARTMAKQYSWDKIARRFIGLYEEIS